MNFSVPSRRGVLLGGALSIVAPHVRAQSFPSKPVKLVVPYSAAYTADAGAEALRQWDRGSPLGALLFLPNITRAFFVIVMASGAAAAIGVPEGISVMVREAALLPTLGDRLIVFAIGIVLFGVPLQLGLALMRWLQRELGRRIVRPA